MSHLLVALCTRIAYFVGVNLAAFRTGVADQIQPGVYEKISIDWRPEASGAHALVQPTSARFGDSLFAGAARACGKPVRPLRHP